MKYSYKLKNLGCAACAMRMEEAIKKIPGVNQVKVNFIMSKLSFETGNENTSQLLKQMQQIISNIESECEIEIG